MSIYTPIDCSDYDVLELVCTLGYELELLLDDQTVVGTATTLETNASAEYLIVRLADDVTDRVRIDRIRRLIVRSQPSRISAHTFGTKL